MGAKAPENKAGGGLGAQAGGRYNALANSKRTKPMTEPPLMSHEDVLRVRLELLQREHRDLDDAIAALHSQGRVDALTLGRLKKRKLMLKDQIVRIEDEITPDIIA